MLALGHPLTDKAKAKKRNQFRVASKSIGALYET